MEKTGDRSVSVKKQRAVALRGALPCGRHRRLRKIDATTNDPLLQLELLRNQDFIRAPFDLSYRAGAAVQDHRRERQLKRWFSVLHRPLLPTQQIIYTKGGLHAVSSFLAGVQAVEGRTRITVSATVAPYFGQFPQIVRTERRAIWLEPSEVVVGRLDVEIVTSPNNPTGQILYPRFGAKYTLLDMAYDEPSYTGSLVPQTGTLLYRVTGWLSSSTKSAGFAANRFGWLVINHFRSKNKALYEAARASVFPDTGPPIVLGSQMMNQFIRFQFRTHLVFYVVLFAILQKRHAEIRKIIPRRLILSKRVVPMLYVALPSEFFEALGILVVPGCVFGDPNPNRSRVSMLGSTVEWKAIVRRLKLADFDSYTPSKIVPSICTTDNTII